MTQPAYNSGPGAADANAVLPMPGLELVLGPPNSGKLGRVIDWWRRWQTLRPLIVVPTASVAEETTRELLRRDGLVMGAAPVLTFDGLVRELLGYAPAYVGDFERELILTSLLRDPALSVLGPASRFPGLVSALATLNRQLDESGRTPDEIDKAFYRWQELASDDQGLAADLRLLAVAYRAVCAERRVVERAEAVRRAEDRIGDWFRPVALYGFTSFTPGQRRLVSRLLERVPTMVGFDHEAGRDVNLVTSAEVQRWRRLATDVTELPAQSRAYSSPDIARLERGLFTGAEGAAAPAPKDVPPPDGAPVAGQPSLSSARKQPDTAAAEGVHFLLAAGERSEAELAAQHVARLIREGFRPRDIAIIVRDVRSRGALLGQVLASCGIPYRLDVSPELAATGLGYAFLNAVRGSLLQDAKALLSYVTGPYSGLCRPEATEIRSRYRAGVSRDSADLMAVVKQVKPDLTLPASADPAALQALAERVLHAGLGGRPVGDEQVGLDAGAFRALTAALHSLEAFTGGSGVPTELILDALGRVRLPGTVAGADAVTVLTPQRARARRFAAVFILGLVEGEFPGRSDPPSLLSSIQRRRLEQAAGGGLLTDDRDDEQALFVSAVSRSWQLVFLSARAADDNGGEVQPSFFWQHAKDLLGRGPHDHQERTLADVVFSVDDAPAVRHRRRARVAATLRRRSPGRDPWQRPPAALHSDIVVGELASQSCFSPSSLESYLACPFAWFLGRVVGVEEPSSGVDARLVGTLVHAAVGSVYRGLIAQGTGPLRHDALTVATAEACAVIDERVTGEGFPGTPAEKRVVAGRAKQLAGELLRMEASDPAPLRPLLVEADVGGAMGVDIGGVRVRGRMDRVDVDPVDGSLFVVDYKTGAAPSPGKIGSKEALQLPLYLLALEAEGTPSVKGGAYLSPATRKKAGVVLLGESDTAEPPYGLRGLTPEQADALYQEVRTLVQEAAAGITTGRIAPLPDRTCPSWCDLGSACRSRRGARRP